jgi:hypothetical protein
VERSFGTAQDRWLKELRLAEATTAAQANAVLERLLPAHNRRFAQAARQEGDAHRPLGPGQDLAAILSLQEERVVANDYTIRFRNRCYQLMPPVYPGEHGGKVVIELRLDRVMAVRFRGHYLKYQEVAAGSPEGRCPQPPPVFNALAADASAEGEEGRASAKAAVPPGVPPAVGRSGRTPAEPYPPDGGRDDTKKGRRHPAEDQPWRKPFQRRE